MHTCYTFGNYIYTFSSVPLMYSLFGKHISFSLFIQINFNIIHTCTSIHSSNTYYVLSDSHKYSYLASIFVLSYLWSLMYSLIERQIARNYILYVCMYVCMYIYIMYMSAHKYIHSCSSAHIHPSMHTYICTYIHVCLHPSIHTYIQTYIQIDVYMYLCM